MTTPYDRMINHLGHPVQVEARQNDDLRASWVRCTRCDEIIALECADSWVNRDAWKTVAQLVKR